MAGKFKQLGDYLEFSNGYTVYFEAAGVAPYCIFAHVWNDIDKIPMEQFKVDDAGGFLTADNFAKLIYKVSKLPKLEIREEE